MSKEIICHFEYVIRTAVSIGGDCDTLTCIAGGMAEAFYGAPEEMKVECRNRLPEDMLGVLERFEKQDALRNSCYVDIRKQAPTISLFQKGLIFNKNVAY